MTDHHVVYVIELDPQILEDDDGFRDANPNHTAGYECVYVGLTGLTREQRLENHRAGHKASTRVQPYIRDLRPDLWAGYEAATSWEEAKVAEKQLAEDLRSQGYAVWQN